MNPEPTPPSEVPPPDTFREVLFGQVSEPLVPFHPESPEAEEDELTRAALSDPEAFHPELPNQEPTVWRWVVLLLVGAGALALVFGRR